MRGDDRYFYFPFFERTVFHRPENNLSFRVNIDRDHFSRFLDFLQCDIRPLSIE